MNLRQFIAAMRRGWNGVPRNSVGLSFTGTRLFPRACCPMIHAYFGVAGRADYIGQPKVTAALPFAYHGPKVNHGGEEVNLATAIVLLADIHRWTTPQIIEWLKTHLKD